jgi:TonB family protein
VLAVSLSAFAQPKPLPISMRAVVQSSTPNFPENERAKGTRNAAVKFELTLSAQGHVDDAKILESAGRDFDEAAMRAVRQMVFAPDKQTTTQYFTVTFQLM